MRTPWLWLGLWMGISCAQAAPQAEEGVDAAVPATVAQVAADPLQEREQLLKALRENDIGALLTADGDDDRLRDFLNDGADETPDSIAGKIAQAPEDEFGSQLVRIWTTLAGADGVKLASDELHPLWQAHLAQSLAGAQMGLVAMGQSIAEDKDLDPVQRAQLLELQFALTAWMARTDFGDRKRFEQALGHLRAWILASGKAHPMELALTTPQQRLDLAERAMRSLKDVVTLYGIDADALLRSVRVEKLAADGERITLRWSLSVLGVPLVFDEQLALLDGEWRDAGHVERMRSHTDEAPPAGLDGDAQENVESAGD